MLRRGFSYLCLTLFAAMFSAIYVYGPEDLSRLSQATFNALGDELLVLWIFDRISENLLLGRSLFDGGVFFPSANSLAFAESLILPSLFYRGILTFVGQKVVAYHLTVFLLFSLNFTSMYIFCRCFLKRWGALFAASVFTFSLIRLAQLSHLQLIPQFFYPIVGYFLWRYEEGKEARALSFASIAVVGQFYCSIHLGMILLACLVPYVILKIRQEGRGFLRRLVVGGVLMGILLAPLAYPYYSVSHEHGVKRSLGEARVAGANEMNYFSAPKGHVYHAVTARFQRGINQHEKYLFVGLVVLFLAFFSLKFSGETLSPWRGYLLWTLALAILLSMGPNGEIYKVFYYLFPGMKSIRVPARFGFAYLFLIALFAGMGLQWVLMRLRSRQGQTALAFFFFVAFFVENHLSIPLVRIPQELEGVSTYLNKVPKGAVAHLPLKAAYQRYPGDQGNAHNNRETLRMYYSLYHGHSIFNGYSGFWPKNYQRVFALEQKQGASQAVLKELQAQGIDYVVIDKNIQNAVEKAQWKTLALSQNLIYEDNDSYLLRMTK